MYNGQYFSRNFKHFRIYLSIIFFCNGCILHLKAQTPLPTRHTYILSFLGLDHKQSLSIEIPSSNVLRASPTLAVYRARAIITRRYRARSQNLVLQQALYPRSPYKKIGVRGSLPYPRRKMVGVSARYRSAQEPTTRNIHSLQRPLSPAISAPAPSPLPR
jgi:hypothetical protein